MEKRGINRIKENLEEIREKIRISTLKSNRNLSDINLLIATKYLSSDKLVELIKNFDGKILIGENRVQEAEEKIRAIGAAGLREKIEFHMLGHLQSNKVSKAVGLFDCIQSVDSIKIAEKINNYASREKKVMPIYIEVNVSGEQSKFGCKAEEIEEVYNKIKSLKNIKVVGLMTMAPGIEAEQTRPYFKKLYELANKLNLKTSMGMSNDFHIAVEEGSDMIRLGRILFE